VRAAVSLFFLIVVSVVNAQTAVPILKPARVVFYNTENLYDTINDPEINDEEFLPSSRNQWNTEKYTLKLNHTAKVLASLLDTIQPLVIGLSEVENRHVLEDLIAQPALSKYHLGIIHHNSPDERGIDVALLYNNDIAESVFDATLKVDLGDSDRTRDILYFKAYLTEEYPVWFFVNHWPSRRTGAESEARRLAAAKVLKAKIDNIYLGEPYARVTVMGDFNDNPDDKSVQLLLQPAPNAKAPAMVNLMQVKDRKKEFSVRYKDQNDLFDQFTVSGNLLDNSNQYFIRNNQAHIFAPSWLLFNHPKYGLIPNRTYANGKWVGGYSDHLPVYFDIVFK
jgi:predicted extracellular nuclease